LKSTTPARRARGAAMAMMAAPRARRAGVIDFKIALYYL